MSLSPNLIPGAMPTSWSANVESLFEATFENATVGLAVVNLEGRWERVNQRMCEIVGYSRQELCDRTFQDITHPDDLGTELAFLRSLLCGEVAQYKMEKRYLRRDGEPVWVHSTVSLAVNSQDKPLNFVAVVQDLTERKGLEKRLSHNRGHLRRFFRSLPIGAARLDTQGVILDVNPALCRLVGQQRNSLRGCPFWDVLHPRNRPQAQRAYERMRQGARKPYRAQLYCLTDPQPPLFAELCVKGAFDHEGRLEYTIATIRDLSQQLRADKAELEIQATRQFNRALIRAQEEERRKVACELHDGIGQRLAIVALRIEEFSHRANSDRPCDPDFEWLSNQIYKATDELLSAARRLPPPTLELLGLVGALRGECQAIEHRLGGSAVEVSFSASSQVPDLPYDLTLAIYRVVEESLDNAVRHSRASRILVDLKYSKLDELELDVSDNGVGFDIAREGSLGLLLMRERIRHENGNFSIESTPGQGTKVRAVVPLRTPVHDQVE